MTVSKPKILMVLGPAYSGSTLLGLALGQHPEILCLGEVQYLQKDYQEETVCTCGKNLKDCPQWSEVKMAVESRNKGLSTAQQWKMDGEMTVDPVDANGGLNKLLIVLGFPLTWIYGKKVIEDYRKKNKNFFEATRSCTEGVPCFVDLSKLPERIALLSTMEGFEVYCLRIKRKGSEVFASTIKRPKRTRAKYGFKTLREAIWLNLRKRHEKRVYRKFTKDRRMELSFEDFTTDVTASLNRVFQWLDLPVDSQLAGHIDKTHQHLYVGNRWLFRSDKMVEIKTKPKNYQLSRRQKLIYYMVSGLLFNRP